jgi:hypothetical protein
MSKNICRANRKERIIENPKKMAEECGYFVPRDDEEDGCGDRSHSPQVKRGGPWN